MFQLFVISLIYAFIGADHIQYFSEWDRLSKLNQVSCFDIPKNLTLCHGIGYERMRLPNLLDHDTVSEVIEQSSVWIPLLNLKCHPDTRLFLCSLFSPVCLESYRPIYPCRSLCDVVKQGCEKRMNTYGFPWPTMLYCEKFPMDNDMCLTVQSKASTESLPCNFCNQPETLENIIDHFCRADFVVKTKIKKLKKENLLCKKTRLLKSREGITKKGFKRPSFNHPNMTDCCGNMIQKASKKYLLIMGTKTKDDFVVTFIMEWKKSAFFKKVVKLMKKIDCADPKMLSETVMADGLIPITEEKKQKKDRYKKQQKVNINQTIPPI